MKYLVIGLGSTGLSVVSMLKYAGLDVEGYNRPGKSLEALKSINECKVEGLTEFSFKTNFITEDLHTALIRSDLVFVCVPATEHRSLANSISEGDLGDAMPTIILVPGRVFGALNFRKYLSCSVGEAQTVPYAARYKSEGILSLYARKERVVYSSPDIFVLKDISKKMPLEFQEFFTADDNYQKVTLSNIGCVLHCAPMVFNAGLINLPYNFLFYKELVSEEIGLYMQKIDAERLMISERLGMSVQSAAEWLNEQYGAKESLDIYHALHSTDAYSEILAPKTLNHRYINEDLVYGLVPLEHLGGHLGLTTPYISSLINLACLLMDCNFRLQYEGLIPNWRLVE